MDRILTAEIIAVSMTIAVTTFAAVLLVLRETPRRDQALLLAAFLFLYNLNKLDELGHLLGVYLYAPFMAVMIFPAKMLLGPAIYYYARSMTAPAPQALSRKDGWALMGPLAAFAIAAQFLFLSPEAKLGLVSHEYPDLELQKWALFNCKLLFALFLGFSVAYLAAAFRLFLRHARRVRSLFSNIEDKSLDWLRWVLIILVAGWACYAASEIWQIQGGRPAWLGIATAFFELFWLGAIAVCGILQRPVFDAARVDSEAEQSEAAKYARSALSEERMARIAMNLDLVMTRDKLFEDPALSLRGLSDRLGVSENHLSQTFSKKFGANFFDYVNGARIAEARRRLETTDDSILTISHDVGFNSRSTFNAAFKKHAGLTPSQYRQSAKTGEDPLGAPSVS